MFESMILLFLMFLGIIVALCGAFYCKAKRKKKHGEVLAFIDADSTPLNERNGSKNIGILFQTSVDQADETEIFRKMQGTFHITNVSSVTQLSRQALLCIRDEKNFFRPPNYSANKDMSNRQIVVTGKQFGFLPIQTTGNSEAEQGHSYSTEYSLMKLMRKNHFPGMYYLVKEQEKFVDTGVYGSGSGFLMLAMDDYKKQIEVVHLHTGCVFIWKNIEAAQILPPVQAASSAATASHFEKCRIQENPSYDPIEKPPPSYHEACEK